MANNFTLDSIEVEPKIDTFIPGLDYMTDFDNWLLVQVRAFFTEDVPSPAVQERLLCTRRNHGP